MQKYHEKENTQRSHRRAKRYLAAIIAVIMALSISTIALADDDDEDEDDDGQYSGQSQNSQGGGKSGGQGGQQPTDATSGATPTGKGNGNTKAQGGGQQTIDATSGATPNGKGNGNAKAQGNNTDKIVEAIAALTDTDVQASLTTLLNAYMNALEAKQTAIDQENTAELDALTVAVTTAKAILDAALEAAGIDTDLIYGVPEDSEDGSGKTNGNRPDLNTDEIATAIAALTDTDVQASLTALLTTYQEALGAWNAAETTTLSQEELQTLADAVQSAETALLEAARNAEIIGGYGRGQFVDGYAYGKDELDLEDIAEQIAALSETDANKATLAALLTAYQTALAAQQSADQSALTDAEYDALTSVTQATREALRIALEAAGIDATNLQPTAPPTGTPQPLNQQQEGEEYQTQVLAENGDVNPQSSGGAFSSFLEWFNGLFD